MKFAALRGVLKYFVCMTMVSRGIFLTSSPTIRSLSPLPYASAVSIKLIPASYSVFQAMITSGSCFSSHCHVDLSPHDQAPMQICEAFTGFWALGNSTRELGSGQYDVGRTLSPAVSGSAQLGFFE